MASSFGVHRDFKGEFDPEKLRAPWDKNTFVCGQNGARFRARKYKCETHGASLTEGCRGCDLYRKKYEENFRGCGTRWTGGDTCWTCVMKRAGGTEAMIAVMPKVEYLRYNGYAGRIPEEVLRGRVD